MVGWGCGREDQACIGQGVEQGGFFSAFVVWLQTYAIILFNDSDRVVGVCRRINVSFTRA